jgi:hypothetical protein
MSPNGTTRQSPRVRPHNGHQLVTTRPGRKYFQRTSAPNIGVPFGLSKLHRFTVACRRASKRRLLGRVWTGGPHRMASGRSTRPGHTSFVRSFLVCRLTAGGRWRASVRALVAERDARKERLESVSTGSVILRLRLPLQCARLWLYIAFVLSLRGRQ